MRIELELVGPEGTCVLIDDFDPQVDCSTPVCGDVVFADGVVNASDAVAVLGHLGSRATEPGGQSCLDAPPVRDGFINMLDFLMFELFLEVPTLCDSVMVPGSVSRSGAGTPQARAPDGPVTLTPGSILVAGKRAGNAFPPIQDRIYTINRNGQRVREPQFPPVEPILAVDPRTLRSVANYLGSHGLRKDAAGRVYQLHTTEGLIRFEDKQVVAARRRVDNVQVSNGNGALATVYVGAITNARGTLGMPILDVAFDRDGCIYITPVTVMLRDSGTILRAAARLRPVEDGQYEIMTVYGTPPADPAITNYSAQQPWEIELDSRGRVFVVSNFAWNKNNWLLVYDRQTGEREAQINLDCLGIEAPANLLLSGGSVWLTSAINEPTAAGTRVWHAAVSDLLSGPAAEAQFDAVTIRGMGHATALAEDASTGSVWAIGVSMPSIPETMDRFLPELFTVPYLAQIPSEPPLAIDAVEMTETHLALPLSMVFVDGSHTNPISRGDHDRDGDVDLADFVTFQTAFTGAR